MEGAARFWQPAERNTTSQIVCVNTVSNSFIKRTWRRMPRPRPRAHGEPASTLMLHNFIETMKVDDIMGPAVINMISLHYQ